MESALRVTWTLTPSHAPQVRRYCGGCKTQRSFACSDKFRLNAQKKLIDVWLIYRCTVCSRRWNCPVIKRRPQRTIDPAHYAAMTANSARLVRRYACDLRFLEPHAQRAEPIDDVTVTRSSDGPAPSKAVKIIITIAALSPCAVRLDRLISNELGLPRSGLRGLSQTGAITVSPGGSAALKRPVRDKQVITIRLAALDTRQDLRAAVLERALRGGQGGEH